MLRGRKIRENVQTMMTINGMKNLLNDKLTMNWNGAQWKCWAFYCFRIKFFLSISKWCSGNDIEFVIILCFVFILFCHMWVFRCSKDYHINTIRPKALKCVDMFWVRQNDLFTLFIHFISPKENRIFEMKWKSIIDWLSFSFPFCFLREIPCNFPLHFSFWKISVESLSSILCENRV